MFGRFMRWPVLAGFKNFAAWKRFREAGSRAALGSSPSGTLTQPCLPGAHTKPNGRGGQRRRGKAGPSLSPRRGQGTKRGTSRRRLGPGDRAAGRGTAPAASDDSRVSHPLALYGPLEGWPPPKTGGEINHTGLPEILKLATGTAQLHCHSTCESSGG